MDRLGRRTAINQKSSAFAPASYAHRLRDRKIIRASDFPHPARDILAMIRENLPEEQIEL